MARDYTALPFEYLEEMDYLSDAEYGRLIRALQKYSMTGEQEELDGRESAHWKRVRMREDKYRISYAEQTEQKREAGKAGAMKRWNDSKAISANGKNSAAIFANGKNSKHSYNENEYENENKDNSPPSIEGRTTRARFNPPTVEEVKNYCLERKNSVNAERFVDYYAQQGWRLSNGNALRDWKAAVRTWEQREPYNQRPAAKPAGDSVTREAIERNRRALERIRGEL